MAKKTEQFNMVILGIGGQGLITLLQIIAQAALIENYDVKTSELHGLAQRGGSVEVHARFGKKIFSPLIPKGKADMILGLEMQEALKGIPFANQNTIFLINQHLIPISFAKFWSEEKVLKILNGFTKNINLIPATKICKEKLKKGILAGVYLLSLAAFKNLIPLKPISIQKAIKKVIPKEYLELNQKTFNLAQKHEKE